MMVEGLIIVDLRDYDMYFDVHSCYPPCHITAKCGASIRLTQKSSTWYAHYEL